MLMLKLSFVPFAIILLLGFVPESFSETELKTVEIFVQPPTGLTIETVSYTHLTLPTILLV